jgi:hypothetical protein
VCFVKARIAKDWECFNSSKEAYEGKWCIVGDCCSPRGGGHGGSTQV